MKNSYADLHPEYAHKYTVIHIPLSEINNIINEYCSKSFVTFCAPFVFHYLLTDNTLRLHRGIHLSYS